MKHHSARRGSRPLVGSWREDVLRREGGHGDHPTPRRLGGGHMRHLPLRGGKKRMRGETQMSTYWFMECADHIPPLRCMDEFTQHTDDRAFKSALTLIANRPIQTVDFLPADDSEAYFGRNARRFLRDHPTCRIELVSEYGERRDSDGTNIRWEEP